MVLQSCPQDSSLKQLHGYVKHPKLPSPPLKLKSPKVNPEEKVKLTGTNMSILGYVIRHDSSIVCEHPLGSALHLAMPSEPIGGLYRKVVIGTTLRLFEGASC